MNYNKIQKRRKLMDSVTEVTLKPVRFVLEPMYKKYEARRQRKRYTEKEITQAIQYMLDHWTQEDDLFLVEKYSPLDYDEVKSFYDVHSDMSYHHHKKAKKRLTHIDIYQNDEYTKILKTLCAEPMTDEEKRQQFKSDWDYREIKDRTLYWIRAKQHD